MEGNLWLFLLVLYFVSFVESEKAGIMNGEFAKLGQFPYMASLQILDDKSNCRRHFCGGFIIDEYYIGTAAACVIDKNFTLKNYGFAVVTGTPDLNSQEEGVYRDVQELYVPLNWVTDDDLNFAMLKLRNPLPIGKNPNIGSIKLPKKEQYSESHEVAVMPGFGTYYQHRDDYQQPEDGPNSQILQYAYGTINVNDITDCKQLKNLVCVEGLGLSDGYLEGICRGDYGGPLVDYKTNTLIGIASTSVKTQLCGINQRFARVDAHLEAIEKIMHNKYDDVQYEYKKEELQYFPENFPSIDHPFCEEFSFPDYNDEKKIDYE